jgi:hypothetical protein
MRMSRSLIFAAASCVLGLVAVPSQASAEPAPTVTISMSRIGPDISFVPSEINLYNCKSGRPWMPFIWETRWSFNDPDAAKYAHSEANVIATNGRLAVTQGSKHLGSVSFTSINNPHDSFPTGIVPIELSKADLCALRAKGLGGPNANYRMTVESAQATAKVEHYSSSTSANSLVNSYVVTKDVQGAASSSAVVPQAASMTKIHVKRKGKRFTFKSQLRVQDSRGRMVKGPSGIGIGFNVYGRGNVAETETKKAGKVTATVTVGKKHVRRTGVVAWNDPRPSRKMAWFKHTEKEATKIRKY